jgi:hypothetical protein
MLNSSEISLRRAVATASKKVGPKGNIAEAIKESALGQMDLINQAQGFMGGVKDSKNLEGAAIGMAVQGLEIAYHVLSGQMQEAKFQRKQFVDECENQLATFVINKSKEVEDFSKEEIAIDRFYQLLQKECSSFLNYFGIQAHPDEDNPKINRLSILPFFQMSQALQQKSLVASDLDQHRQACFLFLKTGLPTRYYYQQYKNINRIFLQLEGIYQKENYLNRFRAPRFIVVCMANLLWNLLFPVDAETGIPLTLGECVNACLKAELFLNLILDDTQENFLQTIDDEQGTLNSFLIKTEMYIKSLHQAFEFERLREINLTDVSNSMHRALRIMANKITELIFKRDNAAETLVGQLMFLGELTLQNPGLMERFFPKTVDIPGVNSTPCSMIDLLILFIHESPYSRKQIINKAKKSRNEALQELGTILSEIHQSFIIPFEENALKSFKKKNIPMDFYLWIGKRFIALVVMVMECFNIFEDTRAPQFKNDPRTKKDKEQRNFIINIAASSNINKYYEWSLSIFLKHKSKTSDNLDQLLHEQNKMLMMTRLLDQVGSLFMENRIFLQQPDFQTMLLDCLKKIEIAYKGLNDRLNSVEAQMMSDAQIQRHEKRVIQPMLDDLEATLEFIQRSILQVSQVISAPGFSEQEKKLLQEKTAAIQSQFQSIFQGSTLLPLEISLDDVKLEQKSAPSPKKSSNKALIALLQKCYDGMSSQSQEGIKGDLLIKMKQRIQKEPLLTQEDIKGFIIDLLNITATPRSNYFFQAAYGQTRSAKTFIQAVLNERFNQEIPIAAIIFDNPDINLKTLNEAKVLQRIQYLKQEHHWCNLADQLREESIF